MESYENEEVEYSTDIAVVGLACRFPGADNIEEFWGNLVKGVESINRFTKEELKASGESEDLINNKNYVAARGILKNIEYFDATFFGFNATDARMTDPQQRLFLECAWEALESAGYTPQKFDGSIAVYASMADSLYLQNNLLKNNEVIHSMDWFQTRIATSITTLSTQLSYRLNLNGPSISVASACSSSLVAIALACKGLIDFDSDIAIAGAATISVPQALGYLYQEDGIESPDGHCRSFDANAKGTVFSNGVGTVVLKRLQDAIDNKDTIYCVIKGWNINNDGASKVGFSAPSVIGQSKCIASALNLANISAETISYVETHGTATAIGDPIEISALRNAFELSTDRKQFCAIGSVKTNIGHTDIASGMASVIKTILALKNKLIPASLHYVKSNPEICFDDTPFYVNAQLKEWDLDEKPRRAGVNASGIGGTNAFLVLEEFDQHDEGQSRQSSHLLLLSAKTKTALDKLTENLSKQLMKFSSNSELDNAAYTLQVGRSEFNYRRILICNDNIKAASALKQMVLDLGINENYISKVQARIVFMFSGLDSYYPGIASDLYYLQPQFKNWLDFCCDRLDQKIRNNVYSLLLDKSVSKSQYNASTVQPALFILEYSLSMYLIDIGIRPEAMIGYGIGEYVAACIAEVLSLDDMLQLIVYWAQVMSDINSIAILNIQTKKKEDIDLFEQFKGDMSAINTDVDLTFSGDSDQIRKIEELCRNNNFFCIRDNTLNIFHARKMDPILEKFRLHLKGLHFKSPKIPYVSNVTGNWISSVEATDPEYWKMQLNNTVQFNLGVQTLYKGSSDIYLEIGPGKGLTNFVKEILKSNKVLHIQNCLPENEISITSDEHFLSLLGNLWLYGVKIDWLKFNKNKNKARIRLPTYPFERQYYWIKPDEKNEGLLQLKQNQYPKWFYEPSWARTSFKYSNTDLEQLLTGSHCWIIISANTKFGRIICKLLESFNQDVIKVNSGENFLQLNEKEYSIDYKDQDNYIDLIKSIKQRDNSALYIINLLALTQEYDFNTLELTEINEIVYRSFYSSLFFIQAAIECQYDNILSFTTISNELCAVLGSENINPAKASAIGPCRVIPREHPNFNMRIIDLVQSELLDNEYQILVSKQIIQETFHNQSNQISNIIAYRQLFRWVSTFQSIELTKSNDLKLRERGVYVLTGGLGGIGLTLAKAIAEATPDVYLYLISRSNIPAQEHWHDWLKNNSKNHPISRRIAKLIGLQKLGANVTVLTADVTNQIQMQSIIRQLKAEHGQINGLVHAAGLPGGGLAQLKTKEIANKVLAPKIDGTFIITQILQNEPLDFILLCSSVSAVIAELSQVDYCAANACLDAFANLKVFNKRNIIKVINWNSWREVGMAAEVTRPADIKYFDRNNDISPEEGARIFRDVLNNDFSQVIISNLNLNALAEQSENSEKTLAVKPLHHNSTSMNLDVNLLSSSNKVEEKLIHMWENLLGIDGISIDDDFIDLGGHSLMSLSLLTTIDQAFNIKLNLKTLQEASTVRKLAKVIINSSSADKQISEIVVPIRAGSSKSILWCFHPVGGTIFCYLDIAKYIIDSFSIYGIQDPSIQKNNFIYNNLQDMACSYVTAIQKIQPCGPYFLAGLSFGATLALEVAIQLKNKGHEIKPLIFFDAWAKFSTAQKVKDIFVKAMQRLSQGKVTEKKFNEFSWKRMEMLLEYMLPKAVGKIILFKAEELLPEYQGIDAEYNYWDKYTDEEVDVHMIPGDHETILQEPNVKLIARKLNEYLIKLNKEELQLC